MTFLSPAASSALQPNRSVVLQQKQGKVAHPAALQVMKQSTYVLN